MAYDRQKIFDQAKEVIKKNRLVFVEDIVAFLPISKPTFYEFFQIDSNEFNELKDLLELNKTELKVSMRSKWYKSDAPALQMALYKLIASPEEHKALQMAYQDHTTKGESINIISLGNGTKPETDI